jgi:RNA polymerase sigma factor (sigma-70 family)
MKSTSHYTYKEPARDTNIIITEEIFEKLFKKYFPYLTRIAMGFMLEVDTAKDLVVSVFVKVWNEREKRSFESDEEIIGFLRICTRNASVDQIRKSKTEQKYLKILAKSDEAVQMPAEIHWQLEKRARTMASAVDSLYTAIQTLPPQYKRVIELSMQDKKVKEIARIMGITEVAVYRYRTRAVLSLRNKLSGNLPALLILLYMGLHP